MGESLLRKWRSVRGIRFADEHWSVLSPLLSVQKTYLHSYMNSFYIIFSSREIRSIFLFSHAAFLYKHAAIKLIFKKETLSIYIFTFMRHQSLLFIANIRCFPIIFIFVGTRRTQLTELGNIYIRNGAENISLFFVLEFSNRYNGLPNECVQNTYILV